MRTTLAIDDALLARAKHRAAERRVTLGDDVNEALRAHLAQPASAARRPVLPVFDGGALRPGISASSNRDLYDALDASERMP